MEAITTKKISNTFFFWDPIRTENLETNRNVVVHIFVYQRVVQVVFLYKALLKPYFLGGYVARGG